MSLIAESEINDVSIKALLRRFTSTSYGTTKFQTPFLNRNDWEHLRFYWSVSEPVKTLISHVLEHQRETKSVLVMETVVSYGDISGVLDSRASVIEQLLTADPTKYVLSQPNRSYSYGPNHMVVWTLNEALKGILSLAKHDSKETSFTDMHKTAHNIEQILKMQVFKEVVVNQKAHRRPGHSAIRAAAKSRVPLYKKALDAYLLYEFLEQGNQDDFAKFLSNTVLGSFDISQKFELATSLLCAYSIGESLGIEPVLNNLLVGGNSPLAKVGRFHIYWQFAPNQLPAAMLEPAELLIRNLLISLGLGSKGSRTDVSIKDAEDGNKVIALLECKYFSSEDSLTSAVQEAVAQIVRYSRECRPDGIGVEDLIRQSLVVPVVRGSLDEQVDGTASIGLVDFPGMVTGSLKAWVQRLITSVKI